MLAVADGVVLPEATANSLDTVWLDLTQREPPFNQRSWTTGRRRDPAPWVDIRTSSSGIMTNL